MATDSVPTIREFSGPRAAKIVGISYRQLDHWDSQNVVSPSVASADGSGSRRRYRYDDLIELMIVKRLRDSGVSLKKIRSIFEYIRGDLADDVASSKLVVEGADVVLVRDDAALIDMLQRGQGVLNILSLPNIRNDVEAAIVSLFPEEASPGDEELDERPPAAASAGGR